MVERFPLTGTLTSVTLISGFVLLITRLMVVGALEQVVLLATTVNGPLLTSTLMVIELVFETPVQLFGTVQV